MGRITAFWNRGWIGKVTLTLLGFVVVCCVLSTIISRTAPRAAQQATFAPGLSAETSAALQTMTAVASADTPASTAVPTPPDTPVPMPIPTDVPAPTHTPEPTALPTEVPTPTPLPAPVVLKGHGKKVTDPLTPPFSINRVVFTHTGKRNFIVKMYTKDGKEDFLVNAIGAYRGQRPLITDQEVYFEIDADGDWTATIEPLSADDSYAAGAEGTGDMVSDLFQPSSQGAVPFTFSHAGKRNFIVQLHCAGGDDFVANEIGAIQGEVVVHMQEGPCLWEVQADGKWSVKPK